VNYWPVFFADGKEPLLEIFKDEAELRLSCRVPFPTPHRVSSHIPIPARDFNNATHGFWVSAVASMPKEYTPCVREHVVAQMDTHLRISTFPGKLIVEQ